MIAFETHDIKVPAGVWLTVKSRSDNSLEGHFPLRKEAENFGFLCLKPWKVWYGTFFKKTYLKKKCLKVISAISAARATSKVSGVIVPK